MAHDQQAADSSALKPDDRVSGAAAHWGYRFTANGTDYGDFTATLARITRWADWCREWGVTATHYEQLAEAAEDEGRQQTATGAWQRAALAWHWGKFVFVDDPVQQRAAHERAVACFLKASRALSPPAELVHIPYGDTTLAAYLRVPAGTGFANAPVVIMAPGLDSTKEELQATAEYFLARGLATVAIDGPGQGESEYELPIEPAYEKGQQAVVALAGPYRFDLDWDELPPQTRATFQARSGAKSEAEARAKAAELTLENAAAHIETPLLVVGGGRDRIVPAYHQERLASEVKTAELALYPDGSHGVTNRAYESRSRMADWLAARLNF